MPQLPIFKYIIKKLNKSMHSKWSKHYDDLYGVIDDDTFIVEKIVDFEDDFDREEF